MFACWRCKVCNFVGGWYDCVKHMEHSGHKNFAEMYEMEEELEVVEV